MSDQRFVKYTKSLIISQFFLIVKFVMLLPPGNMLLTTAMYMPQWSMKGYLLY